MQILKNDRGYRIIKILEKCNNLDETSILARMQVSDPDLPRTGFKEDYLDRLVSAGQLFVSDTGRYFPTAKGLEDVEVANVDAAPPQQVSYRDTLPDRATSVTVPKFLPASHGNYTGRELQRTVTRPGAYDAFSKPSLIGSKHHYRRDHAH